MQMTKIIIMRVAICLFDAHSNVMFPVVTQEKTSVFDVLSSGSLYGHCLRLFCLITLCIMVTLSTAAAATADAGLRLAYFQGLVGAAGFDEDQLSFAESTASDPNADPANDLSTMPYLGIAGQFPLDRAETHLGIDASLLVGWRADETSIAAGNGQARVEIDSDLWLVDLAIGLYAQTMLGERWRLYCAAGPMLLFGEYSDDTTKADQTVTPATEAKDSNSDGAFGVGGYAKLGLEYRFSADALMGIAVRGIATNLEFDQAVESGELTGIQGFVTFTRAY